jgi:hypothetical protein
MTRPGLTLVPFARLTGDLGKMEMVADVPGGRRIITGIRNVRLEGERIKASQRGESGADWLLLTPDAVAHIDVRLTLRTDDGALVYLNYRGRADWEHGYEDAVAYCTFLFETAHEDYLWLNRIVTVGRGQPAEQHADYQIYELR